MQDKELIVFTSICMNYFPKAMILGKSLKATNPKIKFYVILLEKTIPNEMPENANAFIDKIILAKDLGWDEKDGVSSSDAGSNKDFEGGGIFDKFIFAHTIVESATSVKGQALVYLLKNVAEKVVYIDPDIKIFGSFNKLYDLLENHSIILTPHLTIPEDDRHGIDCNELCSLMHGVFNLGFLAVKNDEEGMRFATWWNDRLKLYCYDDIPHGIFTDQKWVDLAPAFFDVFILKDLGYNVAPWNLSKRHLSENQGKLVVNDEAELVFIHFSGFDSGANKKMLDFFVPDKKNVMHKLTDDYITELAENQQDELGHFEWTYSKYQSGKTISDDVRKLYRNSNYVFDVNPFSLSDETITQTILPNSPTKTSDSSAENKTSLFRKIVRKVVPLKIRTKIRKIING